MEAELKAPDSEVVVPSDAALPHDADNETGNSATSDIAGLIDKRSC